MTLGISGWQFNVSSSRPTGSVDFYALSKELSGQDISNLFARPASSFPSCAGLTASYATMDPCSANRTTGNAPASKCPLPEPNDATYTALSIQNTSLEVGYDWDEVNALFGYMVVNGQVLNLGPYLKLNPSAIPDDPVDAIIRSVAGSNSTLGKDATKLFWNTQKTVQGVRCLTDRYTAGTLDKMTPGEFLAE